MSARSPYLNLYDRLVANTAEPLNAQQCWVWTGKRGKGGYPRFNLYVPGLGTEITLMAHIALWVWLEARPESVDAFYLCYLEFTASGLELDHMCVCTDCIFVDHLQPVTSSMNNVLKFQRRQRA
jgi:hypothetical protein